MKKSTVAVGIIAILGIGYVGTSWYTGNVIENNIDKKIEQIIKESNDALKERNIAINYSDYQKNLFSTKLHLTITESPKDESDEKSDKETLFDDDITIHHGPFPLAALKKGTFTPQMAWVEYEMTEKASPELWALAGNQPLVKGHVGISYQEYVTLKLINSAVNLNEANSHGRINKLDISAGEFSFESSKDYSTLLISANLDKLDYADNNDMVVALNKLKLSVKPNSEKTGAGYQLGIGNISFTKQDYRTTVSMNFDNIQSQGDVVIDKTVNFQASVDKITVIPDTVKQNKDTYVVINQFVFNQHSTFNPSNQTADGAFTTTIGSLSFGQQNLGSGSLDFEGQGIDQPYFAQMHDYDDTVRNDDHISSTVSLKKLNWHNAAGDIDASAFFVLSGERSQLKRFDINNMDSIKLKIDAPFNVLAQMSAQIQNPQSNTVTDDQLNKANQSIQMMSAMLLRDSPLMEFKKGETDGIYSDVDYARNNEEAHVNGNTLTKEEFLDYFKYVR